MKAWIEDATSILEHIGDISKIEKGDLITTNKIERFIDEDDINFIVAPKGFGKTLLLIYKRLTYKFEKKRGFKFIPSDDHIVDAPSGTENLSWGELMIDFYKDRRNWEGLWRACISLSIVQKIKKSSIDAGFRIKEDFRELEEIRKDKDGLKYPLLRKLIYEEERKTPTRYLAYILTNFGREEVRSLLKEQEFMDKLISEIHIPIAIFIDNVDEYFKRSDINVWYVSQQELMFAVKNMCRLNHHLDIFVSIRKEAYEKLSDPTDENIRIRCLDDVQYSFTKLKEIFEKNIEWTDEKYLSKPEKVRTEPIVSFLGFNKIKNVSTGEEEDVFSYIYRHTLKRPRDIVAIGRRIKEIDGERTEENVRSEINSVATKMAKDYIEIFLPHTCFDNNLEVEDLFKLIPHNILHLENLKDICSKFNGGCDNKRDCKNCDKKHVFCDLYKLGLLGTVEFDAAISKKNKQRFLRPGEQTFEHHILPTDKHSDRDYYLIHPILNELIGGYPETRINNAITIGDGKDWTKPELPEFLTKKYKMFLCHSRHDKSFADRLANDIQESEIHLWYDKWNIKVGDSIVDKIDKGIKKSEYLGIVISSSSLKSGWVKKELNSAIMEELEKKKVVVLPILIEDVWDVVPSFLREKKYADFRTSYGEGLEELMDKIKI